MNATHDAHAATVEEIARTIFDALDTWGSLEEGGFGSQREMVEETWKELTPEEISEQLRTSERVIHSFMDLAEKLRLKVLLTALSDCYNRVLAAREKAEQAVHRAQEQ